MADSVSVLLHKLVEIAVSAWPAKMDLFCLVLAYVMDGRAKFFTRFGLDWVCTVQHMLLCLTPCVCVCV